jgi:hypothetical protein
MRLKDKEQLSKGSLINNQSSLVDVYEWFVNFILSDDIATTSWRSMYGYIHASRQVRVSVREQVSGRYPAASGVATAGLILLATACREEGRATPYLVMCAYRSRGVRRSGGRGCRFIDFSDGARLKALHSR